MTKSFSSGKAAMRFLLEGEDEIRPMEAVRQKTSRELDAEIDAELGPVLTRGSTTPLPPFPGPRTTSQARAAVARASKVTKAAKPAKVRGAMTPRAFFESLSPPLSTRGNSVNTSVIAKAIKAEVAAAIDAGAIPPGTKITANVDHNSIRVKIVAWQGAVFTDAYLEHLMDPKKTPWEDRNFANDQPDKLYYLSREDARLVPALNQALDTIHALANRHNFDESDRMSDYFHVGYYLNVDAGPIEDAARNAIALESNKEFGALMQEAMVAAQALGPACTKSFCGNKDLRNADESCMKRLIKFAAKAAGRPVIYDARRGWVIDDGSKQKTDNLPTVTLGKTKYSVANRLESYLSLIGPRGGESSLVRGSQSKRDKELGQPSPYWQHAALGSDKRSWYERIDDNTFVIARS